jgi:hypothetical protein
MYSLPAALVQTTSFQIAGPAEEVCLPLRNLISAAILNGERRGERVHIPRIPMKTDVTHRLDIAFTRRQSPSTVAEAVDPQIGP